MGRQDAEGIGGEHDDRLGMAGLRARNDVGNGAERIGRTRIFRKRLRVEIQLARHRIDYHVLDDGPKLMRGGPNLRFLLAAQADDFCVAAALEIKDTVTRPAVFVVADQRPVRIGR